jgi:NADH dehydrogenase [ubiquinone] 1 alpha subcomplex assembly factor 7
MIGLWLADIWGRAGMRKDVRYVELGPGRGTLAHDALRAARKFGFRPDAKGSPRVVHLTLQLR